MPKHFVFDVSLSAKMLNAVRSETQATLVNFPSAILKLHHLREKFKVNPLLPRFRCGLTAGHELVDSIYVQRQNHSIVMREAC